MRMPLSIGPQSAQTLHPEQSRFAKIHRLPHKLIHHESGIVFVVLPAPQADRASPTHSLYVSETLVTQIQWSTSNLSNPSHFAGPNNPVDSVSFENLDEFLRFMNGPMDNSAGLVRIPTFDEWRLAISAGTRTNYFWGDNFEVGRVNCNETDYGGQYLEKTTSVRTFEPNPFGLYDALGNVRVWARESGAPALVGGSWHSTPDRCTKNEILDNCAEGWHHEFHWNRRVGARLILELEL